MIQLTQYVWSSPIRLSEPAMEAVVGQAGSVLEVRPDPSGVILRPLEYVGSLALSPTEQVLIRPKIPTASVIWLLGETGGLGAFNTDDTQYAEEPSVIDVLAQLLARSASQLARRGLFRDYVEREEVLALARGRVQPERTLRASRGMHHVLACRYVEQTADVLPNRIVRAALDVLTQLRTLHPATLRSIQIASRYFVEVGVPTGPEVNEEPRLNRLNRHYGPALRLARWILDRVTFTHAPGSRPAPSFLINMSDLWEDHVRLSIGRAAASGWGMELQSHRTRHLDLERRVPLDPDIVVGRTATAVLDAKYKRETRQADVYQALAYAKSLGLPMCTLVYPEDGEVSPEEFHIQNDEIRVLIRTLPIGRGKGHYAILQQRTRQAAFAILEESLGASSGVGAMQRIA